MSLINLCFNSPPDAFLNKGFYNWSCSTYKHGYVDDVTFYDFKGLSVLKDECLVKFQEDNNRMYITVHINNDIKFYTYITDSLRLSFIDDADIYGICFGDMIWYLHQLDKDILPKEMYNNIQVKYDFYLDSLKELKNTMHELYVHLDVAKVMALYV